MGQIIAIQVGTGIIETRRKMLERAGFSIVSSGGAESVLRAKRRFRGFDLFIFLSTDTWSTRSDAAIYPVSVRRPFPEVSFYIREFNLAETIRLAKCYYAAVKDIK